MITAKLRFFLPMLIILLRPVSVLAQPLLAPVDYATISVADFQVRAKIVAATEDRDDDSQLWAEVIRGQRAELVAAARGTARLLYDFSLSAQPKSDFTHDIVINILHESPEKWQDLHPDVQRGYYPPQYMDLSGRYYQMNVLMMYLKEYFPKESWDRDGLAARERFETAASRAELAARFEQALGRPVTKPDSNGAYPVVSSQPRPFPTGTQTPPVPQHPVPVAPTPPAFAPAESSPTTCSLLAAATLAALAVGYALRARRR
jgi:hypothetical protein